MADITPSNDNNSGFDIADAIAEFSLSGPAIAILSSTATILAIFIGTGFVVLAYLCVADPAKAYQACVVLLVPFFGFLLHHKEAIKRALRNFRKPIVNPPQS